MRDSIDWPLQTQPPRTRRRTLLFLIAIIAVVAFGSSTALSYWVDLLWFRSLGYAEVFWKTFGLKWGIFAAFAAVTFLILYGAISAVKRAHSADLPADHTIFIAEVEEVVVRDGEPLLYFRSQYRDIEAPQR